LGGHRPCDVSATGGINVVFYYGAVLWQAVGFSEADSLKINILSGTLSICACVAAIFLIDRIGRKPLLLIGSIEWPRR